MFIHESLDNEQTGLQSKTKSIVSVLISIIYGVMYIDSNPRMSSRIAGFGPVRDALRKRGDCNCHLVIQLIHDLSQPESRNDTVALIVEWWML